MACCTHCKSQDAPDGAAVFGITLCESCEARFDEGGLAIAVRFEGEAEPEDED